MTNKYVHPGKTITVVLAGTVTTGDIYSAGGLFGIYSKSGVSGDTVAVHIEGVFNIEKDTSTAFEVGDRLYWDTGNSELCADASFEFVGICVEAASSSATTVDCYLHPGFNSSSLIAITSGASSGGGAAEALTVTGLLSTDAVVAVSQKTAGSNGVPLEGWSTVADDALTCSWGADPGAGAVVVVLVQR